PAGLRAVGAAGGGAAAHDRVLRVAAGHGRDLIPSGTPAAGAPPGPARIPLFRGPAVSCRCAVADRLIRPTSVPWVTWRPAPRVTTTPRVRGACTARRACAGPQDRMNRGISVARLRAGRGSRLAAEQCMCHGL